MQEIRTQALERQVASLQEQIILLQQHMSYFLSMQATSPSSNVSPVPPQKQSSNPFISHVIEEEPKKPQMTDSSTQYTIIEQTPKRISPKPQSDKTFFNQVLGQVNQILDNTDESNNNHIDSRTCKFIDSDTSAMSLFERTNPSPKTSHIPISKKSTDKSSVMDSLASKYLMTNGNDTREDSYRNNGTNKDKKGDEQDTIDVSTTCYNYLKKYDLLKNYTEEDSCNDVLDQKLLKTRQVKLL